MIIEYSHKEMQEAVLFHYKSNTDFPQDIDTITIGEGHEGYFSARLRVKELTKAAKLELLKKPVK